MICTILTSKKYSILFLVFINRATNTASVHDTHTLRTLRTKDIRNCLGRRIQTKMKSEPGLFLSKNFGSRNDCILSAADEFVPYCLLDFVKA